MIHKLTNKFSIVAHGYLKLAAGILKAVFILAAAAGINILLIYPLWYSAIRYSRFYTTFTGAVIIFVLMYFTVKGVLKKASSEKAKGNSPAVFLLRPLVKTGAAAVVLLCLYLLSLLFFKGHRIAALTGLLLFLFAAGLVFFSKKGT